MKSLRTLNFGRTMRTRKLLPVLLRPASHRVRVTGMGACMRAAVLSLAGALLLMGAEASRTVILVRHAERTGTMTGDEGLSAAGRCRAGVLAKMLPDAAVKHIFTSEVSRTQETAEPFAKQVGIRPEAVPANNPDLLVNKLRALRAGETALVVGHSNTVPQIIERLGAGKAPVIADNEFDRLFVVTLDGSGAASLLSLRYPGCPVP
jgi:phosphohistidine phosphatase SixA